MNKRQLKKFLKRADIPLFRKYQESWDKKKVIIGVDSTFLEDGILDMLKYIYEYEKSVAGVPKGVL